MTIKNFELYLAAKITQCATVEYLPSYDVDVGGWTKDGATSDWDAINEYRGSVNSSNGVYSYDDATPSTDIVRVTLNGACSVTTMRVYCTAYRFGALPITLKIEISNDNVTYTAAQSFVFDAWTPGTEAYKDYTVNWENPTYCYIKFYTGTPVVTNNILYICAIQVVTNP